MDESGLEKLVEALEVIIKGKDPRLVAALRNREPMAFIAIGNKLVEAGVGEEIAEQCFRMAIDDGIAGAYVNLGLLLTRQAGRKQDAEQAFLAAIDAKVKGAYNSLGNHYAREGRAEEAERCYRSAIEEGDAGATYNLGLALENQPARALEAEALFRQAIANGHKPARMNLALLLANVAERAAEAEALYRELITDGNADALLNLGNLLLQQDGRQEEALDLFKRAADRGVPGALSNAAFLLVSKNRPAEAEQYLRKDVAAGSADAMNNLAAFLQVSQRGMTEESEKLLRQAIELGSTDALKNLALLLSTQKGKETEAGKYFLLALEAGDTSAGLPFAAFQEKLRARGFDFHELTQGSIRGARSSPTFAKSVRSTEKLREALRRVASGGSNDTKRTALELLGPASMAYQRRNASGTAGGEPRRRFASADELLEFLVSEHDEDGTWVYRGQSRRGARHRLIDKQDNVFMYESIFPHDFRFATAYSTASAAFEKELKSTHAQARKTCYRFILHVIGHCASEATDSSKLEWIREHYPQELAPLLRLAKVPATGEPDYGIFDKGFGGYRLWRLFWSLAQHYELSTALLDVTYSPQVAIWFATHPWNETKPPPQEGTGVVYRFDVRALEGLLTLYTGIQALHEGHLGAPNRLSPFLQDLRSIPPSFAARPTGQQGASIFGLDYLYLLEALDVSEVLETYEFEHRRSPPQLDVDRSVIEPKNDPFLTIANPFRGL